MTGRRNGLVALVQRKLEEEGVDLPLTFLELSRMFKQILYLFGCLCEKLFSTINFNKSKFKSRLTDELLQAVVRVSVASSLKPNVAQPCKRKYCQVSSTKK